MWRKHKGEEKKKSHRCHTSIRIMYFFYVSLEFSPSCKFDVNRWINDGLLQPPLTFLTICATEPCLISHLNSGAEFSGYLPWMMNIFSTFSLKQPTVITCSCMSHRNIRYLLPPGEITTIWHIAWFRRQIRFVIWRLWEGIVSTFVKQRLTHLLYHIFKIKILNKHLHNNESLFIPSNTESLGVW